MNQMISERSLDDFASVANLEFEGCLIKFWYHVAPSKRAETTTILRRRAFRIFSGKFGELDAVRQFGRNHLDPFERFVLGPRGVRAL